MLSLSYATPSISTCLHDARSFPRAAAPPPQGDRCACCSGGSTAEAGAAAAGHRPARRRRAGGCGGVVPPADGRRVPACPPRQPVRRRGNRVAVPLRQPSAVRRPRFGEFALPPGVAVRRRASHLIVARVNLGNLSSIYDEYGAGAGYRLASPVLGLAFYGPTGRRRWRSTSRAPPSESTSPWSCPRTSQGPPRSACPSG
jgi:hypothetical protein